MSGPVTYAELFRVSLVHPFYADGRCPDFAVEPDEATRRRLAGHRAILKTGRDHVRVLVPLDGSGQPFVPFAPETALLFHLVPETRELERFTDLTAFATLAAPRFTSAGANGAALALVDGEAPLLPNNVFAEVEVRLADLQATPARLEVVFQASRPHWAYYLVTDLDAQPELEIIDSAAADPLLFSSENRRDLGVEPDPADGVAAWLAERRPDLRRIRFLSDEGVASRQVPASRLGLRRGPDLLSEPLPAPSTRNLSRIEEQDVLYQVVEFLAQPFS